VTPHFVVADRNLRGLGEILRSGLTLAPKYARFDAERVPLAHADVIQLAHGGGGTKMAALLEAVAGTHVLRDPTRGGVATALAALHACPGGAEARRIGRVAAEDPGRQPSPARAALRRAASAHLLIAL
jgi:hypothetical protein